MTEKKHKPPTLTRLQRMQSKQPWCIYCGGNTLGVNVDHMPPVGAFDLRQRWAGMEYLSCEPCRLGTEKMDLVAGLFARLYSTGPATEAAKAEIRAFFKGVGNNAPDVLKEMVVEQDLRGTDQVVLKALPEAAAIFSVGPVADAYLSAFGARVALALHYELTNEILPDSGSVFVHWMSNNVIAENQVPDAFLAMLGSPQTLKQGRNTLADQFFYQSLAEDSGARSAHFAAFRVSFAVQAFVVRDFNEMKHIVADLPAKVFRPGFLKGRHP